VLFVEGGGYLILQTHRLREEAYARNLPRLSWQEDPFTQCTGKIERVATALSGVGYSGPLARRVSYLKRRVSDAPDG